LTGCCDQKNIASMKQARRTKANLSEWVTPGVAKSNG
jgi:hypothetical protein